VGQHKVAGCAYDALRSTAPAADTPVVKRHRISGDGDAILLAGDAGLLRQEAHSGPPEHVDSFLRDRAHVYFKLHPQMAI
jgi:hypothetical protein